MLMGCLLEDRRGTANAKLSLRGHSDWLWHSTIKDSSPPKNAPKSYCQNCKHLSKTNKTSSKLRILFFFASINTFSLKWKILLFSLFLNMIPFLHLLALFSEMHLYGASKTTQYKFSPLVPTIMASEETNQQ